jgi:hypothetical protein
MRLNAMRLLGAIALSAAVLASTVTARSTAAVAQTGSRTDQSVEIIALQWFERMRTGQIDRTQLAPQYSAQLTSDLVQKMSAYLRKYQYGVSPTGAKILRTRAIGDQTFYDVKLIFPRGDSASILLGFNKEDKITGIALMSMAGD